MSQNGLNEEQLTLLSFIGDYCKEMKHNVYMARHSPNTERSYVLHSVDSRCDYILQAISGLTGVKPHNLSSEQLETMNHIKYFADLLIIEINLAKRKLLSLEPDKNPEMEVAISYCNHIKKLLAEIATTIV